MAKELGFDGAEVTLIAAAISEVSRNIVEYAKGRETIGKRLNERRNWVRTENFKTEKSR